MQLRPHPSHGPNSPLPFFTAYDSPEHSASPATAPAQRSGSSDVWSMPANDSSAARNQSMEFGVASACWHSTYSFTHLPQYTPDLQTGFPGALSYVSTPASRTVSPSTIRTGSLARASTSDVLGLLPKGPRAAGRSSSELASMSAPASPSHMGQLFTGYPQAWGNVRARFGSGSSLSDLPLSVRAGGNSSLRTIGGGAGSHGVYSSSHEDGNELPLPGSESLAGLDGLELQHEYATRREERREEGHVKLAVYWELLTAVGWVAVVAVVVSLAAMQLSRTLTDVYVTLWSGGVHAGRVREHRGLLRYMSMADSTATFLRALGALAAIALVSTTARAFLFARAGLKAAERLHGRLIDSCALRPA